MIWSMVLASPSVQLSSPTVMMKSTPQLSTWAAYISLGLPRFAKVANDGKANVARTVGRLGGAAHVAVQGE
jgi:hypothetical protein